MASFFILIVEFISVTTFSFSFSIIFFVLFKLLLCYSPSYLAIKTGYTGSSTIVDETI